MSTYKFLEIAAQTWPEHCAIVDINGSMSYRQLYEQTELLKTALLQAGLSKGMGLGVMGCNSRVFVAAMFAGMACDATVLPLSHQLKQAEIEHILIDTGLHAVIDDQSGVTPIVENSGTRFFPFLEQTLRFGWTPVKPDQAVTNLKDAAFIRYTSGSTGTSKGVVLTHHSIKARVETTQANLNLTPDDTVLWVLPMAYHFLVTILLYIRYGVQIIICKDILAQTMIKSANEYKATLLYASPMHFRLLAADLSDQTMTTLKYAISTSSGIPLNIADAFKLRFNLSVIQAYGIIEAGLPLIDCLNGNAMPESVGYPVNGFSVAILNDENLPVKEGQTGQLAVRGSGMFDAYLKPWQTAEQVMNNGWFMTGDLAHYGNDGRVYICGRKKTMINVSGNKVFPEEIEFILNSHRNIVDSHVFGETHPLMGEIVCAEVIVEVGVNLDVENVLTFCRAKLSAYKIPQRLKPVKHILHTSSGKIKRSL